MESNLIEIKRFLKDHKKFIAIGSIIISILFTAAMLFLDMNKEGVTQDSQEDFEFSQAEVMNEAQPAYFQFYLETQDGIAYGNSAIFNQYFNLKSTKEKAQQTTNVDIETVEEEIYLKELSKEISIINVTRNDSSYLFTASFNLGNERNNLKLAKYYFDLLVKDEMGILEDKNIYIFAEPVISKINQEELDSNQLTEGENKLNQNNLMNHVKNIIIGLILGIVLIIGLALMKVIYGKTLNYSFGYEVEEDNKFILSDDNLGNEDLVVQFVAVPFETGKVILSEQSLDLTIKERLTRNKILTFDKNQTDHVVLNEMTSLAGIDKNTTISELIIIISPGLTTREWYKKQMKFANINKLPTKIVQMNINR